MIVKNFSNVKYSWKSHKEAWAKESCSASKRFHPSLSSRHTERKKRGYLPTPMEYTLWIDWGYKKRLSEKKEYKNGPKGGCNRTRFYKAKKRLAAPVVDFLSISLFISLSFTFFNNLHFFIFPSTSGMKLVRN